MLKAAVLALQPVAATVPRAQSCPWAAQLCPAHRCGGRAARQEGGASSSTCPGSWGNLGSSAAPPRIYLLSERVRRNKDCSALHAGPPGPLLRSAVSPGDSKGCAEATGKELSVPLPSQDRGSQTGLGALGVAAPQTGPCWTLTAAFSPSQPCSPLLCPTTGAGTAPAPRTPGSGGPAAGPGLFRFVPQGGDVPVPRGHCSSAEPVP